jgi:hypothetical protein
MTPDEANVYLAILHRHYNNVELTYPETRGTYRRLFLRYDNNRFAEIIDDLLMTHKFCPKPPEIIEMWQAKYGEQLKHKQYLQNETGEIKCWVCVDKGYVYIKDDTHGFDYYCDQCQAGRQWKYDGQARTKNPSPYVVDPVSKYLPPSKLIEKNKAANDIEPGSGRQEFIETCKRLGMNPKFILQPRERMVEECPF